MPNQDCTIQFGEFNNPSFFVRYSSFALSCKGAKFLHKRFLTWADALGLHPIMPKGLSRADFAFDFLLPNMDFDEDSFVTAATQDSQHRKDGKVQTFTFGRDETVLRVYNKSDEIVEASKKYWFYLLWQDERENVWRVELQVRKETLKRFGLRTFQDLFDDACCTPPVNMQKMDNFVLAAFADKVLTPKRLNAMLQKMKQHLKNANSGQDETLRTLKKELVELETAANRLYEAVKKGLLPMDDMLKVRAQKLKSRRDAVLIEVAGTKRLKELFASPA